MLKFSQKKETKPKDRKNNRAKEIMATQVQKILSDADQKLILMVRE
jgi:hypothetical protein